MRRAAYVSIAPMRCFIFLLAALLSQALPNIGSAADRWTALTTPIFHNLTGDAAGPITTEVRNIAQDGQGFIWMGSEVGLFRWDGYRFKQYTADPKRVGSLRDSFVSALHTDRLGRLWIATNAGGLSRYDPKTDDFVNYGVKEGLDHTSMEVMIDDGASGLWVGTNRGLYHLGMTTGRIAPTQLRLNGAEKAGETKVSALLLDRTGVLWIGSSRGLLRRLPDGRVEAVQLPGVNGPALVTTFFQDSAGRIWVATNGHGIFTAPNAQASAIQPLKVRDAPDLSLVNVGSIIEPTPNEVWLSTWGRGIVAVDASTFRARKIQRDLSVPDSLADDDIYALSQDRSGLVWVGNSRGISRYSPSQRAIGTMFGPSTHANGLASGQVQSLAVLASGRVWAGFGAEGIDILDPDANLVHHLKPDAHNPARSLPVSGVLAITPTPYGTVYLGARRGLYRAREDGSHIRPVPLPTGPAPRVNAALYAGGYLWVAEHGLTRLRLGPTGEPQGPPAHIETELSDLEITALAAGPEGSIWLGTPHSLDRVGRDMKILDREESSNRHDGLGFGGVTSLSTDRFGRLWVGSTGGGINILTTRKANGQMSFRHLGQGEGLPNANIDTILMGHDGYVWVSTDNGLARIDPVSLAVTALTKADGVDFTNFWVNAGAVTPSGELLFGGGGITIVRPDRLTSWTYKPPVVVTDVQYEQRDGASVAPTAVNALTGLKVRPDSNRFRIEFAALDYLSSGLNRYAYKLAGYDQQWIQTDALQRFATYTNLWPGHYELLVRGSNSKGVWSPNTLMVPVDVAPAWYQTRLFYAAAAILAAVAVFALIFWRTRTLHLQRYALERQVMERTAELREQTQIALSASQAKSAFLAMMSHELRTPMNGVLGMAHAHKMTPLSEHQLQQVDMIIRSGESLMTILNDILDISKIEAGKLELEEAPFDLIEVAQMTHDLWRHSAEAKGVKLTLHVADETPPWVEGDPTRVRQIMLNLVSNALKFTQEGEVRLELAPSGEGIILSVKDTGIGISPEQQSRLFQSFGQADASTARRFGGTGLGLAICKQLAELMGGGITLSSEVGKGTRFEVRLPLRPAEAQTKTASDPQDGVPPLDGVSILVVDDNATNLTVATAILGAMGADIAQAADGVEATEMLAQMPFHIVLMDLHMPRLDGLGALSLIRAGRAGRRDIPVIALTADAMAGDNEKLIAAGFDAVQSKPISPSHLVNAIWTLLSADDSFFQTAESEPLTSVSM